MQFEDTFKGISLEAIQKAAAEKKGLEGFTPFAEDIDGNMLCVEEASGMICTWDPEESEVNE